MKTKAFDLNEILRTGKAVTRDGREATNISKMEAGNDLIWALVGDCGYVFGKGGRLYIPRKFQSEDSCLDLFCYSEPEETKEAEIIYLFTNKIGIHVTINGVYKPMGELPPGHYKLTKVT